MRVQLHALGFDALIGQGQGKRNLVLLGSWQLAHFRQFETGGLGVAI